MSLGPRPRLTLELTAAAAALLLSTAAHAQTPEPAPSAGLERAQKATDAVFHWIKLNADKGANRQPPAPAPAPAPAPRKPAPIAVAPKPAPAPAARNAAAPAEDPATAVAAPAFVAVFHPLLGTARHLPSPGGPPGDKPSAKVPSASFCGPGVADTARSGSMDPCASRIMSWTSSETLRWSS